MLGSTTGANDHGQFNGDPTTGIGCRAFSPASFVQLNAPMTTTTLVSSLTFTVSPTVSSLCTNAAGINTWHIFKTTSTTPATIWAVKLNGSFQIPTTLTGGPGGNIVECDPALAFNTTSGCNLPPPAAPITAPIDLHFSKQPETFTTEINLK